MDISEREVPQAIKDILARKRVDRQAQKDRCVMCVFGIEVERLNRDELLEAFYILNDQFETMMDYHRQKHELLMDLVRR